MKVKAIEEHQQVAVDMEGVKGVRMRMLVGAEDRAPNFHMRHFTVEPSGHTPHHRHDYEHEVLVLAGSGLLKSEEGDKPFKPNDVVFVPPGHKHQFVNAGTTPLEFICLIPAPRDCRK